MSAIAIEPYLVDHPLFTWLDYRYIRYLAENAELKQIRSQLKRH